MICITQDQDRPIYCNRFMKLMVHVHPKVNDCYYDHVFDYQSLWIFSNTYFSNLNRDWNVHLTEIQLYFDRPNSLLVNLRLTFSGQTFGNRLSGFQTCIESSICYEMLSCFKFILNLKGNFDKFLTKTLFKFGTDKFIIISEGIVRRSGLNLGSQRLSV